MASLVAGLAGLGMAAATPAVAASGPASGITNPNHFMDTFDNNRSDGWTRVDEGTISTPSRWAATGQELRQLSNIHGGSSASTAIPKPGTNFVMGNPGWKNYAFSADVSTTDDDDIGVVFRYQDDNNYYRFSMNRQHGYKRLVKKVDGKFTLLAENSTHYKTSTTYELQAVADETKIQIYVNGRLTFDVNDAALANGKIGLYTWGSASTTFDNVSVDVQNDDFFTIAVVPDTQYAVASYPAMLASQMKWLATKRATQNIVMVLQEGDVVDDLTVDSQWTTARTYYGYLGGKVPLVVAAGNHDLEDQRHDRRPYLKRPGPFNTFVGSLPGYTINGAYAWTGDYRNTYRLFSAGA